MEFIIIAVILLIFIIVLKYIFDYNIKKLKKIGDDKELDELTKSYPNNIEICRYYLKKLNNQTVKIEENKDSDTSLYVVFSNKIIIANVKNSYTRIQTIAHECLHSVQDRKLLIFNFIISNVYLVYFIIIIILGLFKVVPNKYMFLCILFIISFAYYMVRAFLENDAMIKARYLAKEYMEEKRISTDKEIQKIVAGFDKINNVGIKCINYNLYLGIMIKILVFTIICIVR